MNNVMTNIWAALYREYVDEHSEMPNSRELVSAVKKSLRTLITWELKNFGETREPLLMDVSSPYITEGRHVRNVVFTDELAVQASLIPKRGGFTVLIKETLSSYRKRLCLAHELGHTYFYRITDTETPPVHIAGGEKSYYMGVNWGLDEGYTYELAREILLPYTMIKKAMRGKRTDLKTMLWLKKKFKAPLSVVAKRLIDDLKYPDICFVIAEVNGSDSVRVDNARYTKGDSFKRITVKKLWKKVADEIAHSVNVNELSYGEIVTIDVDEYEPAITAEIIKCGNHIFACLKKMEKRKTLLDFCSN